MTVVYRKGGLGRNPACYVFGADDGENKLTEKSAVVGPTLSGREIYELR